MKPEGSWDERHNYSIYYSSYILPIIIIIYYQLAYDLLCLQLLLLILATIITYYQ